MCMEHSAMLIIECYTVCVVKVRFAVIDWFIAYGCIWYDVVFALKHFVFELYVCIYGILHSIARNNII